MSLAFCVNAWRGIQGDRNTWLDLTGCIVLFLAGAGFAVQTFTARVVVSDDCIRVGSIFRSQSMQLDQIRYRREYMESHSGPDGNINVYYLELIPYDYQAPSLKISKDDFDFDRAFWDWMVSIPEREQLER
jgi:hypothetical protein